MLDQIGRELDLGHLVIEDETEFGVDPRVYTDPAIFATEMRRIFGRTWVYVAHESEIPNPGDFRTSAIGQTPVLVTRDEHGEIHVLVNTCRHRGSTVCREERGSATFFRCPYHGWVYRNDGDLVQVPDLTGYPPGWRERVGGLLSAPRVETRYGMIFASFCETVESLDAYLGPLNRYVDFWFGHSPVHQVKLLPPYRASYPGNWKLQIENSTDGAHARHVHESAVRTMERFGTRSPAAAWPGCARGFDHGHGVLERPREDIPPEVAPQFAEFRDLLDELYGPEHAERMFVRRHITVFPNLHLMEFRFRHVQPVAVDRTLIYEFPVRLEGLPDHINQAVFHRLHREISISSGGPVSGFVNADDVEIFARVQTGLTGSPLERVLLSRGMHREIMEPSGERVGESSDEVSQRAIYREWKRLMSVSEDEDCGR